MKARLAFAFLASAISLTLFAQTSSIEGTVRSVDPAEQRVVIVTPSGEIIAAHGAESTPVRFEGSTYRISDLEVGDRIRMSLTGTGHDQRLEAIDVLESVPPEARPGPRPEPEPVGDTVLPEVSEGTTLTSVSGKVDQTRPDRNLIRVIAEGGLSWVRIDATNASTPDGEPFDVSDLAFGETIVATGIIGTNGQLVATTIRRESEIRDGTPPPLMHDVDEPEPMESGGEMVQSVYSPRQIKWLDVVEFEGEIVSPLNGAQTMTIRNDITGSTEVIWCDRSFVAMIDEEDPITAEELEEGMRVEVRALRVSEGLVAQSIAVED